MLEKLFLQVLNMSFTGAIVIAFVLLFRLLLKKVPKSFSYGLWAVVLFRLVCPFSFESTLSLLPIKADPISQDIPLMQTPRIDTGIPALNDAVDAILPAATPYASVDPLQIWVSVGSLLWMLGMALLLAYSLATLIKLNKRLRSASCDRENIFVSTQIDTAFVVGVFRPKIYLPEGLSDRERGYILLHEQTHIRRLDHVIRLLSFLVLCVHWFNPLVWAAFFLCGKDMELSCDEAVIKRLGNHVKKEYSASLLTLATGRRIVGGTPLAFGEGDTKSRVNNVLRYQKPAFWVVLVAMAAVIALTVGLLSDPKEPLIGRPDGFAGVDAVILKIDLDSKTMLVTGLDPNSPIGDQCVVDWSNADLQTVGSDGDLKSLSIEDLADGDHVVLFLGEIQETYPTRATASAVQLQDEILPPVTAAPMTAEYSISPFGQNGEVVSDHSSTNAELAQAVIMDALVRSAAWPGVDVSTLTQGYRICQSFPETGERHDFYAYRLADGTAVLQDDTSGMYTVLSGALYARLETEFAPDEGLFFWVEPDAPPQVIANAAAEAWLNAQMGEQVPEERRISDHTITDVSVLAGDPKQGVRWEDMAYQYVVHVTYQITTATEQYRAPGDGVAGKGTFDGLFRELGVKANTEDGGGFLIVSVGTGGAVQEFG